MAATVVMPLMASVIMILLLNPPFSNAAVDDTASKLWVSALGNCLVSDLYYDSRFLMEKEASQAVLDVQNFQTGKTEDPDHESVPKCDRPPRYDICAGSKISNPNSENCYIYNRDNPCPVSLNPMGSKAYAVFYNN